MKTSHSITMDVLWRESGFHLVTLPGLSAGTAVRTTEELKRLGVEPPQLTLAKPSTTIDSPTTTNGDTHE